LLTLGLPLCCGTAAAASFDLGNSSTTSQTLATGQTGQVQAGKSMTVGGRFAPSRAPAAAAMALTCRTIAAP